MFVATKHGCVTTNICRHEHNFVATSTLLSRHTYFVATKQAYFVAKKYVFCRDIHAFVATKPLSGQKWYLWHLLPMIQELQTALKWPFLVSLKPVLDWANFCFANVMNFGVFDKLRWSYVRGPKSFAQHVLGIFSQFGEPCFWLVESKESSPVDEEEIKNKDGWRCQYFTRFGGNWPICWLVGGAASSLGPRMI